MSVYQTTTEKYVHAKYLGQNSALRPLSTQLNTALSKCYMVDSAGSRAGLKKGGFYIEGNVLSEFVNLHSAKFLTPNFLFLKGHCIFDDPLIYKSQTQPCHLNSKEWGESYFLNDRTSWIELSPPLNISVRSLEISVREVISYSPPDELPMLWFDMFSGACAGYMFGAPRRMDEEGNLTELDVAFDDPGHDILHEYFAKVTR